MKYTEAELEHARDILNAEREEEHKKDKAKAETYIGHYFKTRNSYGAGRDDWWLYVKPTSANEYGHLQGLSFQTKVGVYGNELEIEPNHFMLMSMIGDYEEITREEFTEALNEFKRLVTEIAP